MFISTPKQLSEAIKELTPFQWATEELCKKLTEKEFRYIAAIVHTFGTENKIRGILEIALKRNREIDANCLRCNDNGCPACEVIKEN